MPDDATGTEQGTQQATATPQPQTITSIDQIPQELRNQLEANHRKGLQAKIAELTTQNQALGQLREQSAAFIDLAAANGFTIEEGSELGEVGSNLLGTLDSLQTEQEKLTKANALKEKQLQEALDGQKALQGELNSTLVLHALQGQLGANENGDPRCPSPMLAQKVAEHLASFAQHGDDGKFNGTFEMDVVDSETGETEKKAVDAKTAVTLLEANADWKHFFTATVNSGVGGDAVDGVKRGGDGNIDFNELVKNPAKYMEIMDKNPKLIDEAMRRLPTG